MHRRTFASALAVACFSAWAEAYREIPWEDLMPKDWDPMRALRDMPNASRLLDGTPEAERAMRKLRESWDNAPTVATLDNAGVKLPGYVVPLEVTKNALKEFLLVPYFGACIHTPPPPSNQIVHVFVAPPGRPFRAMETVWVSGRLTIRQSDTAMGTSGYRIDGALVEPYAATAR